MIVAFFGAEDCGMPGDGRGDHLLTFTTALEDGSYRETLQWPRMFSPVEGRGLPDDGFQLPYGRYFLIAFPCPSKDRSCFEDFNTGSRIGGPFTYLRS